MTPLDPCAEELETMEKAVTAGREWCSSQGDTPDLMRRDDDTECLLLIAAAVGQNEDAENMARRLAREEALFAGTSSGANVVAALRVAERLGPGATVVTLMVDSGLKYLSTDVYRTR